MVVVAAMAVAVAVVVVAVCAEFVRSFFHEMSTACASPSVLRVYVLAEVFRCRRYGQPPRAATTCFPRCSALTVFADP